ncbi:MAG: hypothetical protein ACOVQG_03620 [Crocinitomicaceae bacterium]|jgi:hypothetical protein
MGIGVSHSFNKLLNTELSYEYRLKNTREFDKSNVELKFSQNWHKGIETFFKYRNSILGNRNSALNLKPFAYDNRVSFGLDVSFFKFLDVKRTKLNWVITQQFDSYQFKRNSSMLRNRILFKQDIKDFPLSPFLSVEHFYRWNRDIVYADDEIIISGGTNAMRYFIGTDVEISKKQRLMISLGLRDRILSTNDAFILRINYKISI